MRAKYDLGVMEDQAVMWAKCGPRHNGPNVTADDSPLILLSNLINWDNALYALGLVLSLLA
jgi:hypothetical protein